MSWTARVCEPTRAVWRALEQGCHVHLLALRNVAGQDGVSRRQTRVRGNDNPVGTCHAQRGASIELIRREAVLEWRRRSRAHANSWVHGASARAYARSTGRQRNHPHNDVSFMCVGYSWCSSAHSPDSEIALRIHNLRAAVQCNKSPRWPQITRGAGVVETHRHTTTQSTTEWVSCQSSGCAREQRSSHVRVAAGGRAKHRGHDRYFR